VAGRTAPLWLGAAAWAAVVLAVRVWRRAWAPGSTVPVADVTLRLDRFWEGIRSAVLTYVYADQPWKYLREGFRHMEVPWIAMALVVGVALLARGVPTGPRGATAGHEPGEGQRLGILWSTIGVLPIGLVGHHFSAYYVCFSAVGFALLAGTFLGRLPVAATASVLAVSAVLNVAANSTETFLILSDEEEPGVSYVPISRLAQEARFLDSLQVAMRRDPPPRGALVYLSHAPHRASFATAGERAPQVWYRDTTLTLTYIGQYRPGATDRPTRFLRFDPGTRGFVSLPESLVSAIVEGEDRMAAGDWAGARPALLRALDRTRPGLHDIERIELGNSLGVASNRAGDSAAARAAWRGVLALAPTHRGALLNLAGLDASAGHYGEARAQVERLLERHPDDALGLLYLARLERALGDAAAVDRAWSRLVATDRRFADSVLAVSGMP
jgi:hypothetical protein